MTLNGMFSSHMDQENKEIIRQQTELEKKYYYANKKHSVPSDFKKAESLTKDQ